MADYKTKPLSEWTEQHVSHWLQSIPINQKYIDKLYEEEVSGPVLKEIDEQFLINVGMKHGPIKLLIKKRDELLSKEGEQNTEQRSDEDKIYQKIPEEMGASGHSCAVYSQPKEVQSLVKSDIVSSPQKLPKDETESSEETQKSSKSDHSAPQPQLSPSLSTANFRPFNKDVGSFKYVKGHVLPPESGVEDLITPCHEYKSLITASKLDRTRLQAKFASEVIRFACACMNVRTNGTIHFGVLDSKEDKRYTHGQIMGITVKEQDVYVDALDYIERCFNKGEHDAARACIRTPKFIAVVDKECKDQRFVVEVDVVPESDSVKGRAFQASLPKFNEKSNKAILDKKTYYCRIGAKSVPVPDGIDMVQFIQGLQEVDARREKAESIPLCETTTTENITKKIDLLTGGKEYMDDTIWYILVTNKWEPPSLANLNFLTRLKIFCVFDFDAESDESGLCSTYKGHHAPNIHSLTDYANDSRMSPSEQRKSLGLFDQTSWIFCNGRSNFRGGDEPCDENDWIKTRKKHLLKALSLICDELFPRGTYVVMFLLMSPVEKPIVETFHNFYALMNGIEDIICIAENKEYYKEWASLAQASCNLETLEQRSIVGVQLSHINATIQRMFPIGNSDRNLPMSAKGDCVLNTPDEEKMHSLEILCVNECSDKNLHLLTKKEVKDLEGTFYRGGKISWKHLWLAEQKMCEDFIERDACDKVQKSLHGILYEKTVRLPVARIKIFHHPGSGGSTVARQVMWKNKNVLRCAIVRSSHLVSTVSQHAVKLREYEEDNPNLCLPVLLLVEDCEEDYLDDLRHELMEAMAVKKIVYSKPCFILMSCKRSNIPEDFFKASASDTVVITHKFSEKEKKKFSTKATELEKEFPKEEFIITFVLMSREFDEQYVKDFVQNVLQGIDHSSDITRLLRYVALLNCYVQNSYISVSHCEAFLGLGVMIRDQHSTIRQCNFKSYLFRSEQARLLFIELRENSCISSIHIIHPLIAKEVLNQLSEIRPQSDIANDLLDEKVLLQHRFGRDEFIKFTRDLFLLRYRKSRGDSVDTFFSPMIEHVCEVEQNPEKAIKLLEAAFGQFDKDAFFAQQLARLNYMYEKFEEAIVWAETARRQLPGNSFILHTEGQVYRRWFNVLLDRKKNDLTPQNVIELIERSLKSMECFRAAEKAAKAETDCMNDSAFFGEVDVGCRLLQMLSSQLVFSKNRGEENTELLRYLLTDYIPEEIEKPWFEYHSRLKGLYQNIYDALEWIADDVGYFQLEKIEDGVQLRKTEEHVHSPRKWLLRKTEVFAKFFGSKFLLSYTEADVNSQLVRKMSIYRLGGGSVATILSILSDTKAERSSEKLENIIALYPEDFTRQGLGDTDLANYIMSHIALGCVCPGSPKLLSLQELRELGKRFLHTRKTFQPSAYLLTFLLYWPDDKVDDKPDANKDNILANALQMARELHERRIKNVPVRKKRTNVLFFLGKGYGLQKIIHRSSIEKQIEGPLNEKRMKWENEKRMKLENDDLSDFDGVYRMLTNVPGWTENGRLYAEGHCKKSKIEILPLNASSVPHGNENVTFFLGFTFIGFVAYNIQVQTDARS